MPYDRELRYRGDAERIAARPRGEYGEVYEAPYSPYDAGYASPPDRRGGADERYRARFHGYGMGYAGGSLRSRGSFHAGQLRSGLNPTDEFEFQWGDGYVGGRGYGGTNYDYRHGYRTAPRRRLPPAPRPGSASPRARPQPERPRAEPPRQARPQQPQRPRQPQRARPPQPRMQREGPAAGERAPTQRRGAVQGPTRYGYGPYHERLQRRRRSADDIKHDIEETLFYDTWVDADRITVEATDDGVVTLRGTLPNFEEVRYATDDAWDVDGVRGVRTELEVAGQPQEPASEQLEQRREYTPAEVAEANEARDVGGERAETAERSGAAEAAEETAVEETAVEPQGAGAEPDRRE